MSEINETDEVMPSSVLRSEHRVIERVINVLKRLVAKSERGQGFDVPSFERCVAFFRFFADACHHAKEEDLLFPVLESRGIPREGGPIGVMLHEHTLARGYTKQMASALESRPEDQPGAEERFRAAARAYIELLTNHIYKEDNILFNLGDRVMTTEDQNKLCSRFCEVGCRAFGGKTRDELERMAQELEKV